MSKVLLFVFLWDNLERWLGLLSDNRNGVRISLHLTHFLCDFYCDRFKSICKLKGSRCKRVIVIIGTSGEESRGYPKDILVMFCGRWWSFLKWLRTSGWTYHSLWLEEMSQNTCRPYSMEKFPLLSCKTYWRLGSSHSKSSV